MNGRISGGGMYLNPTGVVNDGILDLLILNGEHGFWSMAEIMEKTEKWAGTHIYQENVSAYRGSQFKFISKDS